MLLNTQEKEKQEKKEAQLEYNFWLSIKHFTENIFI